MSGVSLAGDCDAVCIFPRSKVGTPGAAIVPHTLVVPSPRATRRAIPRRAVGIDERARPWLRRSPRVLRGLELELIATLQAGRLIATFRRAAPAHCGAFADERCSAGGGRVRTREARPVPSGSAALRPVPRGRSWRTRFSRSKLAPARSSPLSIALRTRVAARSPMRRVAAAMGAPDKTRAAKGGSSVPSRVLASALRSVELPANGRRLSQCNPVRDHQLRTLGAIIAGEDQ